MTTQTTQGEIRPNINHRFNYAGHETLTNGQLIQAIEAVTVRAGASIAVLQSLCTADAGESLREINPELIFFALESISMDIQDIAAIGDVLQKRGAA